MKDGWCYLTKRQSHTTCQLCTELVHPHVSIWVIAWSRHLQKLKQTLTKKKLFQFYDEISIYVFPVNCFFTLKKTNKRKEALKKHFCKQTSKIIYPRFATLFHSILKQTTKKVEFKFIYDEFTSLLFILNTISLNHLKPHKRQTLPKIISNQP